MKRRVTYYLPEEIYGMLRWLSFDDKESMSTIIGRLIISEYRRRYPDSLIVSEYEGGEK